MKKASLAAPIALYGGTFDPVHEGHIQVALAAAKQFACQVTLLPNATPPHKHNTTTPSAQRLAMLKLACAKHPQLLVSDWELRQSGPSFTLNTLTHWRQQNPQAPIIWIIGGDSFANLHHWKAWQQYAQLCHLAILPRAGYTTNAAPEVLDIFPRAELADAMSQPSGYRIELDVPIVNISSSEIRAELRQNHHSSHLNPQVADYIKQQALYGVTSQ